MKELRYKFLFITFYILSCLLLVAFSIYLAEYHNLKSQTENTSQQLTECQEQFKIWDSQIDSGIIRLYFKNK